MKYFVREDFSSIKIIPANKADIYATPCPKGLSLYEGSQLLAADIKWEELPFIMRDKIPKEWEALDNAQIIGILKKFVYRLHRCRFRNKSNLDAPYILVLSD